MPDKKKPVTSQRVTLYTDDVQFSDALSSALGLDASLRLSVRSIEQFTHGTAPDHAADAVILDVDGGQHLTDQTLHDARGLMDRSTPLVVVSSELPEHRLRDIVRLGAVDWLQKSTSRRELFEAISRSLQKQDQVARVTAFVSAVGGCGASTLAMNAAYMVMNPTRKAAREKTCMLFELDFSIGSCGYFLDIANDYDFKSVLENPNRIDAEFVDIVRKQHPSGFSLISIKAPILMSHKAGAEVVLRILDVLSFQYDVIIVDVPYYETRWKDSVLNAVTDIVIVTEPIIPALRQARDIEQELREVRSESAVTVVVNKIGRGLFSRDLSSKEIERVFGGNPIEFLPYAKEQMVEAANRGIIPLALDGRAAYSKSVRKLLDRFL